MPTGGVTCRDGRLDFRHHLLQGNDRFADHVAATFRKNLILAEEPCYAGCLVFAHGTHHVVHVSVPRVRVGENGDVHGVHKIPVLVYHLRHGEEPDVGLSEEGGGETVAPRGKGLEAAFFDHPGGETVMGAWKHQNFRSLHQSAEQGCLSHAQVAFFPGHRIFDTL
jgi:hypothetical protein